MNKNQHSKGEIVVYQAKDGHVQLDVQLENETIWLSQRQMAELFDKDTDTIGLHIRNVFKEGELEESATTEESSVVRLEGKRKVKRNIRFYNLDVIISVGYRVNSKRGTDFRIWATNVLKQHLVKGYTVNEKRLKALKQSLKLAAAVFLRFAEKNGLIYDCDGRKRIADNALVAMTLMIAESNPKEKDVITTMLNNLITEYQ